MEEIDHFHCLECDTALLIEESLEAGNICPNCGKETIWISYAECRG